MTATKRYYVCDVILVDIGGGDMGNVPAVYGYTSNLSAAYAEDDSWAIVRVTEEDHTPMLSDPRILPLPDYGFSTMVADIPAAELASMVGGLVQRGLDGSALQSLQTYGEVVRAIGRQANASFHESQLQ